MPLLREGEPILGMERFVTNRSDVADPDLIELFEGQKADLVLAPNAARPGSRSASRASHHSEFDGDRATVRSTLARMLDKERVAPDCGFPHSAAALRDRRLQLVR